MSEISFDYPYLLALVVLLPLLAAWVVRYAYNQRVVRLQRLGTMSVVRRLIPPHTLVRILNGG